MLHRVCHDSWCIACIAWLTLHSMGMFDAVQNVLHGLVKIYATTCTAWFMLHCIYGMVDVALYVHDWCYTVWHDSCCIVCMAWLLMHCMYACTVWFMLHFITYCTVYTAWFDAALNVWHDWCCIVCTAWLVLQCLYDIVDAVLYV